MKKAIIVDIDGTLAKMNGRSPFEWMRVGEDLPNEPICNLVRSLQRSGHTIIIFSGRDECCKELTLQWLLQNEIYYEEIYMRPEGNNEKDAIIKKRLYDQFISHRYDIEFVLDDRDQVVDMWRNQIGLTCLQVAYGNF